MQSFNNRQVNKQLWEDRAKVIEFPCHGNKRHAGLRDYKKKWRGNLTNGTVECMMLLLWHTFAEQFPSVGDQGPLSFTKFKPYPIIQ